MAPFRFSLAAAGLAQPAVAVIAGAGCVSVSRRLTRRLLA
jgi:hypothetical protein